MRTFKIFFSVVIACLAFTLRADAQQVVSNYSIGQFGTEDYEHFEFWTKDGKRADIYYSFGSSNKLMKLRFSGTATVDGQPCFKVAFLNGLMLYVSLAEQKLHIFSSTKKYDKIFAWEYIGSVDGKGTFCSVCAADQQQAAEALATNFIGR